MKIIGGYARGVELASPENTGRVRPTVGRSREALFNALGDFTSRRVLDLFSGSGALGLEAASRGAEFVMLVERELSHCRIIEENICRVKRTGAPCEIRLITADAGNPSFYLKDGESFDIIFADPPYSESFAFFSKLAGDEGEFFPLFRGGVLIWELPDSPGSAGEFIELLGSRDADWQLRKFGGTLFLWLKL